MRQILIRAREAKVEATAALNDSATATAIWERLPIVSAAQRWGKEVYFNIPVAAQPENPRAEAPVGAVAYWPPGSAFCIFFGQTPYSPVNIVGGIADESRVKLFDKVKDGDQITLERIE